jgi:hypothetical protein
MTNGLHGTRSSLPKQDAMALKIFLGKVRIPMTDEDYEVDTDEEKKLTIAADMNELAYTELILSIDDKTSKGKVAFN